MVSTLPLPPDWAATQKLIERAEKLRYTAIVVTVDLPVAGNRDRQAMAGFKMDSSAPAGNGNIALPTLGTPDARGQFFSVKNGPSATWDDLDRVRGVTRLPLLVKGILTGEDARKAVDHGARAVVVSNHGGRQLDGATASLDALPEVVEEIGSKAAVYLDGGVRRGSDILMALALGAKGVGIGRPILWGLSAGGEAGVAKVLSLLKADLATVMFLTGRRRLSEVDGTLLGTSQLS